MVKKWDIPKKFIQYKKWAGFRLYFAKVKDFIETFDEFNEFLEKLNQKEIRFQIFG